MDRSSFESPDRSRSSGPSRRAVLRAAGLLGAAGALGLPLPASAALDSARILIGANPGGGWDQTGRALGAAMQAAGSAKNVQYDNRSGAAGSIALAQFVNADRGKPGALIVTGAVMVGGLLTNKSAVTLKDATPVARLIADHLVLVVPADSGVRSLAELVAQMKANPGAVKFGGGSRGSIDHITVAQIAQKSGIDPRKINYIAFSGGGEAATQILGSHVTAGISSYSEFQPFIDSGRMRALALVGERRLDGVVVPTAREQGVDVTGTNWRGVYGAPGITPEQRRALIEAVVAATKHPSWQEALQRNRWTPVLLTGDEFGAFVQAEVERTAQTLRDVGLLG